MIVPAGNKEPDVTVNRVVFLTGANATCYNWCPEPVPDRGETVVHLNITHIRITALRDIHDAPRITTEHVTPAH